MERKTKEAMKGFAFRPKHISWLVLVAGMLFILLAAAKPISDFGNYFYGAKFYARGLNPSTEIYDVMQFNQHVEQEKETAFFLNHNTVTPQSMLLYQPFAWIGSAGLSKVIFNITGLLIFAFMLNLFLNRFTPEPDWKFICVCIAALVPLYYNMVFGQTYLFIAAILMGCVLLYERRPILAGVLLSIAVSLKVAPAILLLWLIGERRWKVVLSTIAAWTLTALPLLIMNTQLMREFYFGSLPRMGMGFVTDPYTSSFQGVIVFLRKLMVPDAILNPSPLLSGTERMAHFIEIIIFVVLAVLVIGAWKSSKPVNNKLLLLLLFVNVTSGYTSTYALLLLLPFLAFSNGNRDWIKVMLSGVLFMFPPRLFDGHSPFLEEYKLWIFLVLLIWETRSDWGFKHLERAQLIVGLLFSVLIIFRLAQRPEIMPLTYYHPEEARQDYVLSAYTDSTSVTYVTAVQEGFAQYTFGTEREQAWIRETPVDFYARGIRIRMIAFRGDEALVLSDYHRGPGLFHLYTIDRNQLQSLMY